MTSPRVYLKLTKWPGVSAAFHKIKSQRQSLLIPTELEICHLPLPESQVQSYVHTQNFQAWARSQSGILLASTSHRAEIFHIDISNTHETSLEIELSELETNGYPIAASLARHAALDSLEHRVFNVDCSWVLEPAKRTRVQVLQDEYTAQIHNSDMASQLMKILFLQIICDSPRQEGLLLQYMESLPTSDFSAFQNAILKDGLPPDRHIYGTIEYMLSRPTTRGTVLSLDNIQRLTHQDRSVLLSDIEALGRLPRSRACIAVSPFRGCTAFCERFPLISADTEYNGKSVVNGTDLRRFSV